jgi:hypothetical protein
MYFIAMSIVVCMQGKVKKGMETAKGARVEVVSIRARKAHGD